MGKLSDLYKNTGHISAYSERGMKMTYEERNAENARRSTKVARDATPSRIGKRSSPVAGQLHTSKANPNLQWNNKSSAERELLRSAGITESRFNETKKQADRQGKAKGQVHIGPKGGRYYITANGTKVYI